MVFERIEGSRSIVPDLERPMVLFLLEGPDALRAMPVLEPLELMNAQGVLFEGALTEAVVPDELSIQIVRETFFDMETKDAHRRAAVNYLLLRLEACDPAQTGSLAERVMDWFSKHLDEPVTLDQIAAHLGCSASGLLAAFKRASLRSPMKELAAMRVEQACELLAENELNVSQIARSVGYNDLAAFNHFFCRHTGRSPTDYRNNCLWLV